MVMSPSIFFSFISHQAVRRLGARRIFSAVAAILPFAFAASIIANRARGFNRNADGLLYNDIDSGV